MLTIDFAERSDLGQRLNAHGMQSPGETGGADGGENVSPLMLSMLSS